MPNIEQNERLEYIKDRIGNNKHFFIVVDNMGDAQRVEKMALEELGFSRYGGEDMVSRLKFGEDTLARVELDYNRKLLAAGNVNTGVLTRYELLHPIWSRDKGVILKAVGLVNIPNYEPKKLIRESISEEGRMEVMCKNRENSVKFEDFLHNNGWVYIGGSKYLIKSDDGYEELLFRSFDKNNKRFSATEHWTSDEDNSGFKRFKRLYYPEDLPKITKHLDIFPSYNPRQFIRESFEEFITDNPIQYINESRYTELMVSLKHLDELYIIPVDKNAFIELNQILNNRLNLYFDDYDYDNLINFDYGGGLYSMVYIEYKDRVKPICSYITMKKNRVDGRTKKISIFYPEDKKTFFQLYGLLPTYKPKTMVRESDDTNKPYILDAFDMDDTLVYSKRFEENIKPMLIKEYLTAEIILNNKLNDIGIGIEKLKYEDGRIYFNDPDNKVNIPPNTQSWVRKKGRVYITQPDAYFMTEESMPIGTYGNMVKMYNESENRCIITARNERIRPQTEKVLTELGLSKPNYGLFMFPINSFSYVHEYKANKLLELQRQYNFDEIRFYDDNIKLLKRVKKNLQGKDINIKFYKVTKNEYRQI